ncbi:Alcohol dehydrogenase superfamily protein [Mycena kentingensis (nom. inval.)]|nr:Alcohol dehydrogenase superfamily protein [Mycena kentingensis (nom. inval.)]
MHSSQKFLGGDQLTHVVGGNLDSLVLKTAPIPSPKANEVLVKIKAVSIQFRDLMILSGSYPIQLPDNLVPGSDMAGEIVSVGEDVKGWSAGDRVSANFFLDKTHNKETSGEILGSALGGGVHGVLTEYRVFPTHSLVRIPDHLSFEEASTLPCAAVTAYNALLDGFEALKAGDTVLIQGTGGVSIFALQFVVASGANAIVLSSSDEKLKAATKLGAKHVINYKTQSNWSEEVLKLTGGVGVDRVIEVVGNTTLAQSLASTRLEGSIDLIGVLGEDGDVSPVDIVRPAIFKQIKIRGIYVGSAAQHVLFKNKELVLINLPRFKAMNRLLAANPETTRPVIDKVFEFSEAKEALHYMKKQAHVGKIVIRVAA